MTDDGMVAVRDERQDDTIDFNVADWSTFLDLVASGSRTADLPVRLQTDAGFTTISDGTTELRYSSEEWSALVEGAKLGEFNLPGS